MVGKKVSGVAGKIYLALICLFLYMPILTLVVLSFNATKTRGRFAGFSLRWYRSLFQDQSILHALFTTLLIALISALAATVFGTIVAFAMNHMKKWKKTTLMSLTNIPMLNADIVTGISLMLLFIAVNYTMGFSSVLIAHITFNLPFVVLSVAPRLGSMNTSAFEAAQDLGASKAYAFWKVIFPDIMPNILTGFLLSFTMSVDDFVITHFTKGVGIDTLSTMIYTEQKKGIRPEIYSLSTLMFVTIFVLLILYTLHKSHAEKIKIRASSRMEAASRWISLSLVPVVFLVVLFGYYSTKTTSTGSLKVYNWGEYMDPQVLELFEKETGISVTYDEYETNESMYPIIAKGAADYDLICPSDYMIQKMSDEGLLEPINWSRIPNAKNIDDQYFEFARGYDENNTYSMPYLWGTVGILYNKKMVKGPIDSWGVLWDTRYQDDILMQKSVRDAFGVALKYLGYSLNTTDEAQLDEAKQKLLEQKHSGVVQAYVVDEVRDKMIAGEAAMGVIYSGEALTCMEENEDLAYVIPKEGSNLWMDNFAIVKGAKNKENAEKFLNFLCRPEIMKMNFEYITYSVPSSKARELLPDEYKNSTIAFPALDSLKNCEVLKYVGKDGDSLYNQKWKEIMSE
ncbi:spermidine/putrescine-binding periplasmic protein [Clostridium sp. CAG:167]|nr:spermidine/putrescine-binding periplasmic protein [Clostridium sp. CAG:167]